MPFRLFHPSSRSSTSSLDRHLRGSHTFMLPTMSYEVHALKTGGEAYSAIRGQPGDCRQAHDVRSGRSHREEVAARKWPTNQGRLMLPRHTTAMGHDPF